MPFSESFLNVHISTCIRFAREIRTKTKSSYDDRPEERQKVIMMTDLTLVLTMYPMLGKGSTFYVLVDLPKPWSLLWE